LGGNLLEPRKRGKSRGGGKKEGKKKEERGVSVPGLPPDSPACPRRRKRKKTLPKDYSKKNFALAFTREERKKGGGENLRLTLLFFTLDRPEKGKTVAFFVSSSYYPGVGKKKVWLNKKKRILTKLKDRPIASFSSQPATSGPQRICVAATEGKRKEKKERDPWRAESEKKEGKKRGELFFGVLLDGGKERSGGSFLNFY